MGIGTIIIIVLYVLLIITAVLDLYATYKWKKRLDKAQKLQDTQRNLLSKAAGIMAEVMEIQRQQITETQRIQSFAKVKYYVINDQLKKLKELEANLHESNITGNNTGRRR